MDHEFLRTLARDVGGEDIVDEICALFLAGGRGRGWTSCAPRRTGDADAAAPGAHALKGSAANIGAVAVSAAAAEVERAPHGIVDAPLAQLPRRWT